MGTTWSIHIGQTVDSAKLNQIDTQVREQLELIDKAVSTWNPESELSRFNHSESLTEQKLAIDTLSMIDDALKISELTEGAYDVTLAPVIQAWGFSKDQVVDIPDEKTLSLAQAASGYQQLSRQGNSIAKLHTGLKIDLSSLAKGDAVDKLGELLEAQKINNYLVEIGGEIRTRGLRVDAKPWRVGIEQPDGQTEEGLLLNDAHVASSGSYRNYRQVDGIRYSHILDGRTAKPIDHNLVAVTLLAQSTRQADAWATALLVLGEQRAWEISTQSEWAVQLTVYAGLDPDTNEAVFEVRRTKGFEALLEQP